MFNLFRKKKNINNKLKPNSIKTEDEVREIKHQIDVLLNTNNEKDAEYYEKIGLLYSEIDNIELAIENLEKSLEIEISMGEGYKKLMNHYNQKRKDAAFAKDNEKIDYYLSKMDEMRNIAKSATLKGK